MTGSEAASDAELPGMSYCASETDINGICCGAKMQDHLPNWLLLNCECDETIFETHLNIGTNRIFICAAEIKWGILQ